MLKVGNTPVGTPDSRENDDGDNQDRKHKHKKKKKHKDRKYDSPQPEKRVRFFHAITSDNVFLDLGQRYDRLRLDLLIFVI